MELRWNEIEYRGKIFDVSKTLLTMKQHGIGSDKAKYKTIFLAVRECIPEKETDELHELIKAKYPSVQHMITENTVSEPAVGVPRCPTCRSTSLTKLTAATRAIDSLFFGRLSVEARAQFRCNKCGYLW